MVNALVKLVVFGVVYGAYYFLVFGKSNSTSSKFILSTIAAYVTYTIIDMLFFGGSVIPKEWSGILIGLFFILSLIGYALYMGYANL